MALRLPRARPRRDAAMGGFEPIPPPRTLNFLSWWHETTAKGSVRRDLRLSYDTTDGSVTLGLDKKTATLYRLSHLEGRYGPVGPFDLYVGAALEVLGRRLTLKQTADLATKTWVEAEAARLRRVQERLLDELRTYGREVGNLPGGGVAGSHRTTSASWGLDTGRRRVQNAVDRRQNASDPLRKLARDNEFLRLQVAEYRPVHGEV